MPDDTLHATYFQIVFLIDTSPLFWYKRVDVKYAAKEIRLCVLKVLTYFSNLVIAKESSLRWGYKFFSSSSLSHHCERHDYKEFSVTAFEEFENQVLKKLNECFTHTDVQRPRRDGSFNRQENCERDWNELSNTNKAPVGAKCVSCALTNTLHDFQWIRPDISSPVKIRTRAKLNAISGHRESTRNVVFLLSGCPCDDQSILNFTGELPTTLESLQSILTPPLLFKEFKESCDIRLYWINTGSVTRQQNTSLMPLMEHLLKQLGGCLIPMSSLIIYHRGVFSQSLDSSSGVDYIGNNGTNNGFSSGPVLPFRSVMDFYLCQKKSKMCGLCHLHGRSLSRKDSSEHIGWICSAGEEDKIHCTVKLSSMFKASIYQISEETNAPIEDKDGNNSPNLLWIRGVVNHSFMCPSWLHPMKAYSCAGVSYSVLMDEKESDQTNTVSCPAGVLSGWFQELLLSLSKESKLLILDFADPDSGLPVTGILQPLTSVCGVISIINTEFLVTFEKLLIWNGKASIRKRTENSINTSHGIPKEQMSTAAFVCNATGYPENKEVFLGLPGYKNGGVRQFDSGFLDPWFCFSDVEEESPWSELQGPGESEDEEESENEAGLMKELKELYSRQQKMTKQTPKKKIRTKLQTPKKSKEKIRNSPRLRVQVDKKTIKADKSNATFVESVSGGAKSNESQKALNPGMAQDYAVSGSVRAEDKPCDIKDQNELLSVVHALYSKAVLEGETLPEDLESIVALVSNFFLNKCSDDKKNFTSQFLEEHLVTQVTTLREKYEFCETVIDKEKRFKEYQLQMLLRTEVAVITSANEESPLIGEVVDLLRAISFMKDPNFLSVYLREILLQRYRDRIPKFLCAVYEGLMVHPPKEVLSPSKWSSDDESPVRRTVDSPLNAKQDSNQPRSTGGRVLTRHMSVTEMPAKRREIVVPAKAKPKGIPKEKREKGQIPSKRKEEDIRVQETPVKQVRRNLFTEGEADAENGLTTRVPRKRKMKEGGKKGDHRRKFHRRNTIGSFSRTTVQETPAHKQVSHALWGKQDRARRRSQALTDNVQVLQESPLKEDQARVSLPRRSPRRAPNVIFQRSQSFYGRPATTGPLTRTRSFTVTGTRGSPEKGPPGGSPAIEALFMKAPQASSISPLRFSPRRKKKFSLHRLLNTTKECTGSEEIDPKDRKPSSTKLNRHATKSSPRILKTRSFSCIGFSSVPFEGYNRREDGLTNGKTPVKEDKAVKPAAQSHTNRSSPRILKARSSSCVGFSSSLFENDCEKEEELLFADSGSCERVNSARENKSPEFELSEADLKSAPKRVIPGKDILENQMVSPQLSQKLGERLTPKNDLQMDECVVLLTPIRKSLTSPLRVYPLLGDDISCSRDHVQPRVSAELKVQHGRLLDRPANCLSLCTPVKVAVGSGIRCSPRLQSKIKEPGSSTETSGELTIRSADTELSDVSTNDRDKALHAAVSPTFTRPVLEDLRTLTKTNSLDDCVVLLTPVKHPVASPTQMSHSKDACEAGDEYSEVNTVCTPVKELTSPAVKRLSVSPRCSPRLPKDSVDGTVQVSTQSLSLNASAQPRVTYSLNLKRKSRPSKSSSLPDIHSETKPTSVHESYPIGDLVKDVKQNQLETSLSGLDNNDIPEKTSEYENALLDQAPVPALLSRIYDSPVKRRSSLNQGYLRFTPPPRKVKQNNSTCSSPSDSKRASPLNQILRQKKRKRSFSSSPVEKCGQEANVACTRDSSPCTGNTQAIKLFQGSGVESLYTSKLSHPAIEDDSSEDVEDWLREKEEEFERYLVQHRNNSLQSSPATKKRRIHKSVVFGGKRSRKRTAKKSIKDNSSLSSETSFEEDDEVFQSPAVMASRVKQRRINRTPLSANSIKVLQESPILFTAKLPVSPSSLTRKWSHVTSGVENQNRKDRLRRRKFPSQSDSNEMNDSDTCVIEDEEPTGSHPRKRLKLGTS